MNRRLKLDTSSASHSPVRRRVTMGAIAAIGATARTSVHARRIRWAMIAISSQKNSCDQMNGTKRTNGTVLSRCDESQGSS